MPLQYVLFGYNRPHFYKPSSRIALISQLYCPCTRADWLYSNWIADKNLDGKFWNWQSGRDRRMLSFEEINYPSIFFLQFSRNRVNLLSYESKPTDKWEQCDWRAEKNWTGSQKKPIPCVIESEFAIRVSTASCCLTFKTNQGLHFKNQH